PFARPPAEISTTQPVEFVFDYHVLNLPGEKLAPLRRVYLTAPPNWVLDRRLFAQAVQNKIRKCWKLPAHAPKAPTSVHVQVGSAGELVHFCIVRSSDNAAWDRSVMDAVAESGHFWPLPKGIGKTVEIWLEFSTQLKKRQRSTGNIKVAVRPTDSISV